MNILIHDLGDDAFRDLDDDFEIVNTNVKAAPCQGCFQCWTKNAGYCVYADAFQHSGAAVGSSENVVIVSKICYGGYSPAVKPHLKMYECWCRRTGLTWGGGVGIGGGEMFHCLAVYYPIAFAVLIVVNLIRHCVMGTPVTFSTWKPLMENIGIYLFFNCGIFYCMIRLAMNVRKSRQMKNKYTRVMVPAFLFIPMADLFMTISALFHGKIIFALWKKDTYHRWFKNG